MKNRLNQYVTPNKKTKKNSYVLREKSGRVKLNFSWCFHANLDMISKLDSKFEQIMFLMKSVSH